LAVLDEDAEGVEINGRGSQSDATNRLCFLPFPTPATELAQKKAESLASSVCITAYVAEKQMRKHMEDLQQWNLRGFSMVATVGWMHSF
jgi:hypothetical protein